MRMIRWFLNLMRSLAHSILTLFGLGTERALPPGPARPRKERRLFRFINTSRGGPNAPKFQPCPGVTRAGLPHGKMCKRTLKTAHTARYHCPVHDLTFIVSLRG